MKYFVTYLTSPQVDPDEAAPEGSVTVEADTYEAAAVLALALPLPDRADREQVHVSPEDLGMDARCVFVPLKGEAK